MYIYFCIMIFSLISCISTPEINNDEKETNDEIYTTQTAAQKAQEEYKKLQIQHK